MARFEFVDRGRCVEYSVIERKEYLLRPWDNSPFNQTLVTVESENTQIRKSKKEINVLGTKRIGDPIGLVL